MNADPEPLFFELRPRLLRLAYRMLGSVADAEDVVQDAYARWVSMDREGVREPAAQFTFDIETTVEELQEVLVINPMRLAQEVAQALGRYIESLQADK